MPSIIAAIPTDLQRSALGLPSLLARVVGGKTVLAHTIARVARVKNIDAIVLIHPSGQEPLTLLEGAVFPVDVKTFAVGGAPDAFTPMWAAARRWAPHAWRGGLGGATCYDELLPANALLDASHRFTAQGVLLLGADWLLVDPDLCQRVLDLHLSHPEARQLTFCQAPPGLCGAVTGEKLLEQLANNPGTSIAQILGYVPSRPQPDPIGRDVCVQIEGAVRSCARRFVYDTARSAAMIDALATHFGSKFGTANALEVTAAVGELEEKRAAGWGALPPWVTLELTPRRVPTGQIVPQHYVTLERPDLDLDLAARIVEQVGQAGDTVLMLGGLGDALLHEQWARIVEMAHGAGVKGIGIRTDLTCQGEGAREVLARLVDLPIDWISIPLNADRAVTYEKVMGFDGFPTLIKNIQTTYELRLLRQQRATQEARPTLLGLPWIVPSLVKTPETLPEMENFYDKWTHLLGFAVIEPATSGCGLMPELSPVDMSSPRRQPCRQLTSRMSILSDGRVARCDQDWLGRAVAGDARTTTLAEIWANLNPVRAAHQAGRWGELDLCTSCREWQRP